MLARFLAFKEVGDLKIEPTDLRLKAIFYATVGPDIPRKEVIWRCPSVKTFPEGGKTMFANYLCEIYNSRRKSDLEYVAYPMQKDHPSYRLDKIKELMSKKTIERKAQFSEACLELVRTFQDLIRPPAPPGILFFTVFTHKRSRLLCVLKLEPSKRGVLYVVENLVKYNDFKEALPGPKDMQKGAVYPQKPKENIFKVAQLDGYAMYFDSFLGAYRAQPTAIAVRFLIESAQKVRGSHLEYDEILILFDSLEKQVEGGSCILGQDELADIFVSSVSVQDQEETVRKLKNFATTKRLIHTELVKRDVENMKVKLRLGQITISGPSRAIRNQVQYSRDGDEYSIVVSGTSFKTDAGLK